MFLKLFIQTIKLKINTNANISSALEWLSNMLRHWVHVVDSPNNSEKENQRNYEEMH